jgi:hypothetical protein
MAFLENGIPHYGQPKDNAEDSTTLIEAMNFPLSQGFKNAVHIELDTLVQKV